MILVNITLNFICLFNHTAYFPPEQLAYVLCTNIYLKSYTFYISLQISLAVHLLHQSMYSVSLWNTNNVVCNSYIPLRVNYGKEIYNRLTISIRLISIKFIYCVYTKIHETHKTISSLCSVNYKYTLLLYGHTLNVLFKCEY